MHKRCQLQERSLRSETLLQNICPITISAWWVCDYFVALYLSNSKISCSFRTNHSKFWSTGHSAHALLRYHYINGTWIRTPYKQNAVALFRDMSANRAWRQALFTALDFHSRRGFKSTTIENFTKTVLYMYSTAQASIQNRTKKNQHKQAYD